MQMEGEVGRLEKENSSMQKVQYEALALLNEKDADLMAALAELERLSAENADLRARLEQAERERDEAGEEMKEAAGELLIPLPQSDPTVRKLLLANSIMRQERDAARADLERAQAEAAATREVERLALEYRAKAMEFRTRDRLGWQESEAAIAAGKLRAAGEALFAALDKETAPNG